MAAEGAEAPADDTPVATTMASLERSMSKVRDAALMRAAMIAYKHDCKLGDQCHVPDVADEIRRFFERLRGEG